MQTWGILRAFSVASTLLSLSLLWLAAGDPLRTCAPPKTCPPDACTGAHPDIVVRCSDGSSVRYECLEGPDHDCAWRLPPCPETCGAN